LAALISIYCSITGVARPADAAGGSEAKPDGA
jgi:hypothetical protein